MLGTSLGPPSDPGARREARSGLPSNSMRWAWSSSSPVAGSTSSSERSVNRRRRVWRTSPPRVLLRRSAEGRSKRALRGGFEAIDLAFAGDRALLTTVWRAASGFRCTSATRSVGRCSSASTSPRWYDGVDVEVATAVASRMVLGIQHQRLAEEQRRLAALERRARTLEQSLKTARSELHDRYGFEQIIGRSPVLREALTRAAQVARTETTVLITGESGTGKELVARAIHYASPRADGPSSRSTAQRCPTRCWSRSCSATSAAPSPGRTGRSPDASNWRPRNALPRRDRRTLRRGAGQAPPCAAGARIPAGRRDSDAQGRCPPDRRDEPRSDGRDGRRAVPQRPLLPAGRLQRAPAPTPGTRRRCAPPRRLFHPQPRGQDGQG